VKKFELTWIDKHAEVGPIFRMGEKDVFSRLYPGQRILQLEAKHSPNITYLDGTVTAFHELAELWGAPVLYIIKPDVKKPPAAQFLYEWSRIAYENGSCDQSYMLMQGPLQVILGKLVTKMFCSAGMPFEALQAADLERRLAETNLDCNWDDFDLKPLPTTALAISHKVGEGAYGQLLTRFFRKFRGSKK